MTGAGVAGCVTVTGGNAGVGAKTVGAGVKTAGSGVKTGSGPGLGRGVRKREQPASSALAASAKPVHARRRR